MGIFVVTMLIAFMKLCCVVNHFWK